jgi:adenylate kinase
LVEKFGLGYFSTGKQLRREMRAGTELGREADTYLARSEYVPDPLVLALVRDWLGKVENGWVLDGFPRTLPQAEALDQFPDGQVDGMRALLIDVERSVLEERVAQRCECSECSWSGTRDKLGELGECPECGSALTLRRDDAPEAFVRRMDVYEELSVPVADYYQESGRLVRVSGIGSPEEVFTRVLSALESHG